MNPNVQMRGFWITDAPLTPEQMDEDMTVLKRVDFGMHGLTIIEARVYVNGREWYWREQQGDFADLRTVGRR